MNSVGLTDYLLYAILICCAAFLLLDSLSLLQPLGAELSRLETELLTGR